MKYEVGVHFLRRTMLSCNVDQVLPQGREHRSREDLSVVRSFIIHSCILSFGIVPVLDRDGVS